MGSEVTEEDRPLRGPGRLRQEEYRLTDEQRAALGIDRWFRVPELVGILGITKEALHNAIDRGHLASKRVYQSGKNIPYVKGLDAIRWRDGLSGVSDGDDPPAA